MDNSLLDIMGLLAGALVLWVIVKNAARGEQIVTRLDAIIARLDAISSREEK